jgi:hypothetical protein
LAGHVKYFLFEIVIVSLGCKNEKERAGGDPPALPKDG